MKVIDLSLSAGSFKRIVLILLTAALLLSAGLIYERTSARGIPGKTKVQRLEYLNSLGWNTDPECEKSKVILLPEEFPEVLKKYNELQLRQGFDLTKYAGKEVAMYKYEITDFPDDPHAECSLYVYRGRIIGGDIHSPAINGFMMPLQSKENG